MSYSNLTQYFGFGDAPTAPPDPAPASNPMALSASDVVPPLLIALVAVVGIGYLLSSRPSMTPNRRRRGKKRGRSRGKRRGWKRGRKSSRRSKSYRRRGRGKSRRSRGKRRGRRGGKKWWKKARKWGRKKSRRWGKKRGRKSWKRGYRNVPWKYSGQSGEKKRALYGYRKYKNTKKGRKKWAKKAYRQYASKINYHGGGSGGGWGSYSGANTHGGGWGKGWPSSSGGKGWPTVATQSPIQRPSGVKAAFGPPGWT